MELKLKQMTIPEVIDFNFTELKEEVTKRTAAYVGLVYTEDQIKFAKKDLADLRKFTKALSDERIRVKKDILKPYEDFEAKIKELTGIVDKAITDIDGQVKGYEEKKKAEKLEEIKAYWNSVVSPDHPLSFDRVMNPKWLNASTSMKSVQEDINGILAKYAEDITTLSNLPEFAFEAVEVYKTTLDLNKAISEGKRLAEIQKRKEEQARLEAERKAEQARRQEESPQPTVTATANVDGQEVPLAEVPIDVPEREWLGFKAHLTVADAQALANFFTTRQIPFEQIAI